MKEKTEFRTWLHNYFLTPFSWSKWTDICTFSYGHNAFLLQGKVNRRTNAKKFKVTSLKNNFGIADVGTMRIERLTECGLIDEQVKYNYGK